MRYLATTILFYKAQSRKPERLVSNNLVSLTRLSTLDATCKRQSITQLRPNRTVFRKATISKANETCYPLSKQVATIRRSKWAPTISTRLWLTDLWGTIVVPSTRTDHNSSHRITASTSGRSTRSKWASIIRAPRTLRLLRRTMEDSRTT